VLRTYGPWWTKCPSAVDAFGRQCESFFSDDFIELVYEKSVYPFKIEIFETYNPGALVRVLACSTPSKQPATGGESGTGHKMKWEVLWSGKGQAVPAESRVFSPPIKMPQFAANTIRLEFNSRHLTYYTELDAVRVHGYIPAESAGSEAVAWPGSCVDPPCYPLILPKEDQKEPAGDFSHINRAHHQGVAEQVQCACRKRSESTASQEIEEVTAKMTEMEVRDHNGLLDYLPNEVLQEILRFLDMRSLVNLSLTCKFMYKHCYEPAQYTEVNLQPFWSSVNSQSLLSLVPRCAYLQKLNLSWCGSHWTLTNNAILNLFQSCGQELRVLHLANCKFVDNESLHIVSLHCPSLTLLDLRGNRMIDSSGFRNLSRLVDLRYLNLYRTRIDTMSMMFIARSCPGLEHVNIGSCTSINNFDDVALYLASHCKNLRSLDMWRGRTLSDTRWVIITPSMCRQLLLCA
jgi:F-box/leucine-rich repeat protein 4